MLERRLQQRTAYLLLVLLGLVGAFGTQLHGLFACCDYCECSASECCIALTSETASHSACTFCQVRDLTGTNTNSGNDESKSSIASYHVDCAICQLLDLFHTTTIVASWQHSIYGNHDSLAIPVSTIVVASPRCLALPRGPPAQFFTGCYA